MNQRSFLVVSGLLAALWLAMFLLGGAGSATDLAVLRFFYAGDRPALASIARFVTELGGWRVLTALTVIFAGTLLLRGHSRRALLFLASTLTGRAMVELQKWLSARARPEEEHLVDVTSLSFPSGHSANSTVFYVAIALLLAPLLPSAPARRTLLILAAAIPFAVGLSRMMLGVHWPTDVVGGWAFGLFWTFLFLRLGGFPGTPGATPSLMEAKENAHEQRE
jgi:undecaprenyl-diphosphatase